MTGGVKRLQGARVLDRLPTASSPKVATPGAPATASPALQKPECVAIARTARHPIGTSAVSGATTGGTGRHAASSTAANAVNAAATRNVPAPPSAS